MLSWILALLLLFSHHRHHVPTPTPTCAHECYRCPTAQPTSGITRTVAPGDPTLTPVPTPYPVFGC